MQAHGKNTIKASFKAARQLKDVMMNPMMKNCTLCYLAGGSNHDIHTNAGISNPTFYKYVHHGIDAINSSPGLKLIFNNSR
jgi:hypothetical protein